MSDDGKDNGNKGGGRQGETPNTGVRRQGASADAQAGHVQGADA
jgi:hypothetical protein